MEELTKNQVKGAAKPIIDSEKPSDSSSVKSQDSGQKDFTIEDVKLRVNKESDSGITEIFITSMNPTMNCSVGIKGDIDVTSGLYDLVFVKK